MSFANWHSNNIHVHLIIYRNTNGQVSAMVGGGVSSQPNSCPSDWLMVPCAKVAGE